MEIVKYGSTYAKVQIDPEQDEFLHQMLTMRAKEMSEKYNDQIPMESFHISLNLKPEVFDLVKEGELHVSLDEEYEMTGYAFARVARRVSLSGYLAEPVVRTSTFIRFAPKAFLWVVCGGIRGHLHLPLTEWTIHPHISLTNLTGSPYDSVKAPFEEWVGKGVAA